MTDDLIALIEPLARMFFGEPNKEMSSTSELRFGTNGSKSIKLKTGQWYDHELKEGGGVLALIRREVHLESDAECYAWLEHKGLWINGRARSNGKDHASAKKVVAEQYAYEDASGELAFVVERIELQNPDGSFVVTSAGKRKKTFRQKRPDPEREGGWLYNVDGVQVIPYKLPELIEAVATEHPVLIVEGERKADLLWSWGVAATCCSGGANKWRAKHAAYLHGADVVVLPDADDAGCAHAKTVAITLRNIAASVRVLELPGLGAKEDIVDWAAKGGTVEQLHELIERAPEFVSRRDERTTFEDPSFHADAPLYPDPDPKLSAGDDVQPPRRLTSRELKTMTFDPVTFIVPGLIPAEGVTLICAKPKVGKSWLLLDMCLSATADRYLLGNFKSVQGDVLYLALEDGPRRLQSRMTKLLPTFSGEWPENLIFATEWRRVDQGGLDDISEWVKSTRAAGRKVAFIAIDVLKMIRPLNQGKKLAYDCDYEAITGLRKLATDLGVAIVVAHHTRKAEAEDLIDKVSGTFGLVGAADTIIVIERRGGGWIFDVRGRDVTADELATEFNKDTCRWTILGGAAEVHRSAERNTILNIFREAGEPLTAETVTAHLADEGITKSREAVRQILSRMTRNGDLRRLERGKYELVDQAATDARLGDRRPPCDM
jgi:hypothetical protein